MCESEDEQYKREFYYHESNNNIENDDSMSHYTYVSCLKSLLKLVDNS